jgi:hypothetical protein
MGYLWAISVSFPPISNGFVCANSVNPQLSNAPSTVYGAGVAKECEGEAQVWGYMWVISVSSPPFSNAFVCANSVNPQRSNEPLTTTNDAGVVEKGGGEVW